MMRQRLRQSKEAGQDSFLDIVTNIVGILIILVMVIGARVQSLSVNSSKVPRPEVATLTADAQRLDDSVMLAESDLNTLLGDSLYSDHHFPATFSYVSSDYSKEIDDVGGMVKAIEMGIPKMRIEESATKVQARIDSSEKTVVGVNKFTLSDNEEEKIDIKKVDNSQVLANQIERLKKLKSERNNNEVIEKLNKIKIGIKQNKNVLELAVNAARVGATVGEISDAMEEVWDRHKADVTLVKNTYANNFSSEKTCPCTK